MDNGMNAIAEQMNFDHLIAPVEREPPGEQQTDAPGGDVKATELRLRKHPMADAVPPRTLTQRRELVAAMELLKRVDDSTDCRVEVLTLGDQVLWDHEKYEIALDLGLTIRTIPVQGNDATARLCLETLHAPAWDSGIRALVVVVACHWAGTGRPKKVTPGVKFRHAPWTIKEMATLARVGTTRISEAKEICGFGLQSVVLAREISFSEAANRARLVRAAGLSEAVHNRELTFDQAYRRASAEAEVVGADQDRDAASTVDEPAPNQTATSAAPPGSWQEEREVLQARIAELTDENTRMKNDLREAIKELDEERALREVAEEALDKMKRRLEEAGLDK